MTFKDAQLVRPGDILQHIAIKSCWANVIGQPILQFPHWRIPVDLETTACNTIRQEDGTWRKQYYVDGRKGYCWTVINKLKT